MAACCTFVVGLVLVPAIEIDTVTHVDERVTAHLHRAALESPGVEDLARTVTWIGHPLMLAIVVCVAVGVLLRRGDRSAAWWLVLTTAIGATVETALKLTVARTRPDFETTLLAARGTSYPSGHAMNTTIVLVAVALAVTASHRRYRRPAALAAAGIAVLVGITRPVLGVHHVSDVVVGFVLAGVWLAVARRHLRARS